MKSVVAVILCLIIPATIFATESQPGFKVKYDGGSLQDAKAGADLNLYVGTNSVRIMKGTTEIANILPSSITEVSYGQDVHRRVERRHWVSGDLLGHRRVDGAHQIQETLCWSDMGQRRTKGRLRHAM
jgi:hypothetical protein